MLLLIYVIGCIVAFVLFLTDFIYCTVEPITDIFLLLILGILITASSWIGAIVSLTFIIKELKS